MSYTTERLAKIARSDKKVAYVGMLLNTPYRGEHRVRAAEDSDEIHMKLMDAIIEHPEWFRAERLRVRRESSWARGRRIAKFDVVLATPDGITIEYPIAYTSPRSLHGWRWYSWKAFIPEWIQTLPMLAGLRERVERSVSLTADEHVGRLWAKCPAAAKTLMDDYRRYMAALSAGEIVRSYEHTTRVVSHAESRDEMRLAGETVTLSRLNTAYVTGFRHLMVGCHDSLPTVKLLAAMGREFVAAEVKRLTDENCGRQYKIADLLIAASATAS